MGYLWNSACTYLLVLYEVVRVVLQDEEVVLAGEVVELLLALQGQVPASGVARDGVHVHQLLDRHQYISVSQESSHSF